MPHNNWQALFGLLITVLMFLWFGIVFIRRARSRKLHSYRSMEPQAAQESKSQKSSSEVEDSSTPETPATAGQQSDEETVQHEIVSPSHTEEVKRLQTGLQKTQQGFIAKVNTLLFTHKGIPAEVTEELETLLYAADIGVRTANKLLHSIVEAFKDKNAPSAEEIKTKLRTLINNMLVDAPSKDLHISSTPPTCYLFVGVNGVGKTTTIGKIASQLTSQGKSVMLVAGDTFRAAAEEQLNIWAQRSNSQFFAGKKDSDPASVIFDAVKQAQKDTIDFVLVDTAGRLHTKTNLMDELKKIQRVIQKALNRSPDEILQVLDATTGQNAILQAKEFNETLGLTGIILTKLDGTSKGGVVIGINDQLHIPVRYVGIGEQIDDLRPYSNATFIEALFQ